MENEKLAQGVKDLRKRKGLSQEELAKNAGLSLRTIQRVENGETEPTGETLKRISSALDVTPNELIDRHGNKEKPKKTVKTKYEYLHIFDDKLVFSKNSEINDLVGDYEKSVHNVFKTLMVFFVFIPIFTALAIIFHNLGKIELAIYTGAFALLFLVVAFYTMLFTSGSSLIFVERINGIRIQRKGIYNVVLISYSESGRQKDRALILEKNQVENVKTILLSENLIEEKNIKPAGYKISFHTYIIAFIFIYILVFKKDEMMAYYGATILFASAILTIKIIVKLIVPLFNKTTSR